jgi:far upstream element-binding protein
VPSYDPRAGSPRDDPRLAGRGYQPSRSRSRSPPRRDTYSNPYRDERREDPRRGSYRRSNSPDRGYRNSRDPPNRGQGDADSETIRVKSSLVGLIIGRAGENLRKVESESGARVQFLQTKDPHATERQCTITGPPRSRDSAKTAIFAIIEENGGANVMQDKGAYTAGMPGRAKVNLPALRDGEDSTQVMVPDKTVGLIIGRGGETIKDLQERSGCHVNILGETKSINGLRPINLIGSVQAVGVAKDLILEIVESDSRGQQQQQGTGSNAMNPPRERPYDGGRGAQGGSTKTIQVPSQAVGMIIGKGGETIKDLQRTSGCKINVHQPSGQDINRDIDLEGSPRQMEDAERAIWEKVETVQERDGQSGGRGGRAGGGGASRAGSGYDQGSSYDGYSQQQQQPASSGYGQYQPQQQAPAAMPFQMPALPQQGTPASGAATDPAAAAAYQQFYAQWYMQQMMQGQPGAGAPGQQ